MTDPTILPPDADPIATLRTMAAFGMDEGRGIAEIVQPNEVMMGNRTILGLAILCKAPEAKPIPIFDTATRAVEVTMLADWLKARGYEASACRWQRQNTSVQFGAGIAPVGWQLVTGPAEVPKMPPEQTPLDYESARQLLSAQYPMRQRTTNNAR